MLQLVLAVLFLFKLVWALGRRLYVLDREILLLLLLPLPPRWIMLDTKLWARDLVDDAPTNIYVSTKSIWWCGGVDVPCCSSSSSSGIRAG